MARLIPDLPDAMGTGFIQRCLVCDNAERSPFPTRTQAQDAAVWHVYEHHPEEWRRVIGDRPPLNPDPRKARA